MTSVSAARWSLSRSLADSSDMAAAAVANSCGNAAWALVPVVGLAVVVSGPECLIGLGEPGVWLL